MFVMKFEILKISFNKVLISVSKVLISFNTVLISFETVLIGLIQFVRCFNKILKPCVTRAPKFGEVWRATSECCADALMWNTVDGLVRVTHGKLYSWKHT